MPFRILSLSGGGIRGVFQARYLAEIAKSLVGPLSSHFQLIAGTSTGAIIALGIALDVPPATLVNLFEEHGYEIFPPKVRHRAEKLYSWGRKGSRYSQAPLRKVLEATFGNKRLADCNPPVLISATTLDRFECRVFTTLPRCGLPESRDADLLASEVALASSAAPLFFPAERALTTPANAVEDPRTYVDGGMWANTPSSLAVKHAKQYLGAQFEDMRLISIGNGEMPSGVVGIDFNITRRAKMLSPILDMMFATQMELSDRMAGFLLGDEEMTGTRMLRVNVNLEKSIALDDVEGAVSVLPALAVREARNNGEKFIRLLQS
jgi:patatin-like phospholipase/acyl hydrolase